MTDTVSLPRNGDAIHFVGANRKCYLAEAINPGNKLHSLNSHVRLRLKNVGIEIDADHSHPEGRWPKTWHYFGEENQCIEEGL
jgi:hypothetical protein